VSATKGYSWGCELCKFDLCVYCVDSYSVQPYTPPTVPLESVLSDLRQDDDELINHVDTHYEPLQVRNISRGKSPHRLQAYLTFIVSHFHFYYFSIIFLAPLTLTLLSHL